MRVFTFCIYGLHNLHGQFSNFQFFTSLVDCLLLLSFSFQQESYATSKGPRYEMLSLPLKIL